MMLIPILGIFAAALFYGDSVITPAISVLSAVEGLEIVAPGLSHWVTPITLMIIAVLFTFQKLGTDSVGKLFGPVMCIWFATLAVLGIYNILDNPSVLVINPMHAIHFAIRSPLITFFTLGGVVLVLTGSEALYADMGHFGKLPIQIAWTWLVFPALLFELFRSRGLFVATPRRLGKPVFHDGPRMDAMAVADIGDHGSNYCLSGLAL